MCVRVCFGVAERRETRERVVIGWWGGMIHTFIHFSCVRHGWKMVVGEEDIARGVPFFKTPVVHCSYRSINPHKSARISFLRRSLLLNSTRISRVPPLLDPCIYLLYISFAILDFVSYSPRAKSETKNRSRSIASYLNRGIG